MPIKIDQTTQNKLFLVKQIFQQAEIHASAHQNVIRRALAVIEFDLAIDTMLKVVIIALKPIKLPKDDFEDLVQQAGHVLSEKNFDPIPELIHIREVHKIRNGAQHRLQYPDSKTVSDCRTHTHDFLKAITKNVWGLDLDEIRLANFIQHKKIKKYMVDAEKFISKRNKLKESIEHAAEGFELALYHVKEAIFGYRSSFVKIIVEESGYRQRADSDILNSFNETKKMLMLSLLSINYADFMKYKSIVGEAVIVPGGPTHFFGMPNKVKKSDAEFVVSFCSDAIIQIESIVGNIDDPFGKEKRKLAEFRKLSKEN